MDPASGSPESPGDYPGLSSKSSRLSASTRGCAAMGAVLLWVCYFPPPFLGPARAENL